MAIIIPYVNSRRFSSTAGAGTGTGAAFNILATAFTDDTGGSATAFPSSTTFRYYNLYVNGMPQTADTSTVTTTAITIPNGDALDDGTPILVEFIVT